MTNQMNYASSLKYLNAFINYERIHGSGLSNRSWNLDRMRFLLRAAGFPQKSYRRVLIAGTKGKGSTGFFLETLLENSGVKTGFYSSPHLNDPRERIRIRGHMVSKEAWAAGLSSIQRLLNSQKLPARLGSLTYFEIMTLLAAYLFKRAKIEVGIFEVGLGGRLDATNALDHELSVITPIHLDHEAFLGNTIAKIAEEKAAIIRKGSKVVISAQVSEACGCIKKRAQLQKAVLIEASPVTASELPLKGAFQRMNAGTALTAARELGFSISQPHWKPSGVWPGRMEWLNKQLLIDGAHNPMAVRAFTRTLKEEGVRDPVIIFGTSKDKNAAAMLEILSRVSKEIVLTPISNPRTHQLQDLLELAKLYFPLVFPAVNIQDAFKIAKERAKHNKIVALGSFYLIGDLRKDFYAGH